MFPKLSQWPALALAFAVSLLISYFMTPPVKRFAEKIGAMDIPKDDRRVHDHPIPRMGGLAIIMGFVLSVLLFVPVSDKVYGIVIGSFLIAGMGLLDDIVSLRPSVKFAVQIFAALVCVRFGLEIDAISWPSAQTYIELGPWGAPLTMLWIVLCTNAFNLIDGLDGLAVGVSTISCITILVVALRVAEPNVAVIVAALAGACIGFMPYNLNPAKIFMGDTGSLLLGYVLSTVSVLGLFKFYTVVTFVVPVLALAVPLSDTLFAFVRRVAHGQSPFQADRGHFHHKLMDLGLNQKQAVAILYAISAALGLAAVTLTTSGAARILLLILALVIAVAVWAFVESTVKHHHEQEMQEEQKTDGE